MSQQMNKTKIRFAAFDVVVLIVAAALALTLIFRFTTNMKLYTYNTEKYTVTVRAEGLQYITIDMISLSDSVYFENGKYLGQIVSSPTVTPKMVYELGASGDFIPAYYPDNTLVDMTTSLECDLHKMAFILPLVRFLSCILKPSILRSRSWLSRKSSNNINCCCIK